MTAGTAGGSGWSGRIVAVRAACQQRRVVDGERPLPAQVAGEGEPPAQTAPTRLR